jgi:hypothetical protein
VLRPARHGRVGDFLGTVAKAYPRRQLHVVLDNSHTHKHAEIDAWLAKNPRVHLHFTPTSGSWLNRLFTVEGVVAGWMVAGGSVPG